MKPLPFVAVTTETGSVTHLGLNSPAIRGHGPDRVPRRTLCGLNAVHRSTTPIADISCLTCLLETPVFMTWPAFGVLA